jgi:hypothetical protein
MKEYKKTKRTHFNYELRTKNSELFTKRTHFPHFSIKNRCYQNLYTCILAYLYSCFVKTNPFYNLHFTIYN